MDIVRNWMTQPAIVIVEGTPLPAARQLLHQHRIRRLPVVDVDGRLVGIVSEGDINRISDVSDTDVRQFDIVHTARNVPVRDVMTREVVSVGPDLEVVKVAQLLLERRIGGVPVVEHERVIGVIAESDLFRLIVARKYLADHSSSVVVP